MNKELNYKKFVDVFIKDMLKERIDYLEEDKKEPYFDDSDRHDFDVMIKELQSILNLVDRFEKEKWF